MMSKTDHMDILLGLVCMVWFICALTGYMGIEMSPIHERFCLVTAIINGVVGAYLLFRREISRVLK